MAIEKFRPYIDGVQFTVVTDHASLKWLQNLKEPHGKLVRWAVRLQAFDIIFEHRPGTQIVLPDALSRSVELVDLAVQTNYSWYNRMYELAKEEKLMKYIVIIKFQTAYYTIWDGMTSNREIAAGHCVFQRKKWQKY